MDILTGNSNRSAAYSLVKSGWAPTSLAQNLVIVKVPFSDPSHIRAPTDSPAKSGQISYGHGSRPASLERAPMLHQRNTVSMFGHSPLDDTVRLLLRTQRSPAEAGQSDASV